MLKRSYLASVAGAGLLGLTAPALASGDESNIFNADIGNFIFTLLIFGAVVYILGKAAWRPILTVLKEREETIRGDLTAAKKEREDAAKLLADYQKQLDRARADATAIVEEGRANAEVVRRRIQNETRTEAQAMLERALREIRLATDAAVKELYDQTAELSVQVAGSVLRKQLSAEDHRTLVAESLDRMKAADRTKLN